MSDPFESPTTGDREFAESTIVSGPNSRDRPDSPETEQPDTVVAPSLTRRFIHGAGGMGRVWMARDQLLGRDVALKELRPDRVCDERTRARFHREVTITAQLQHPGVVPIYEFNDGSETGSSYYTMKFLRGRTLTEVLQDYHHSDRQQSNEEQLGDFIELLDVFGRVCDTMAYAHSRGVIHRDLKGDNVLIGTYGEVFVIDWGLAKRIGEVEDEGDPVECELAADPLETSHGTALGTPSFMSPEQARGDVEKMDELTDVYGLAAILYQILTGHAPFEGSGVGETLTLVLQSEPVAPRELNSEVPSELESLCLKGLSRNSADRPAGAAALGQGVTQWITEQAAQRRTEYEREQFFRMSLDVMATLDADGFFQQVNPAFVENFGWSAAELREMSAFTLLHQDDVIDPPASFRLVAEGKTSLTNLERRIICKDGSLRWIEWYITKLPEKPLVYAVGRDIGRQKQQTRVYQGLLDASPDAMLLSDTAGTVEIVNRRVTDLTGYSSDELIGQPLSEILTSSSAARCEAKLAEYADEPSPASDEQPADTALVLDVCHRDGTALKLETRISPFATEAGLRVSFVMHVCGVGH